MNQITLAQKRWIALLIVVGVAAVAAIFTLSPTGGRDKAPTTFSAWSDASGQPAGHREDADEGSEPPGPDTLRAFHSLRLGMSRAEVESAIGPPFNIPPNPEDPSGQNVVMTYAYRDGWVSVGCTAGGVISLIATGVLKDGRAYPLIQSDYANQHGKPLLTGGNPN